ncbi:hypothetical protein D3C86_2211440 [compost metagenome]
MLALSNATLHAAVMAVNHAFRATKVRDHLIENKDGRYKIKKAPSWAKIRAVMIEHGYML